MRYFLACFLLFGSVHVVADGVHDKHAFASLVFENDAFFRDDEQYSHGLFLNWGYSHVDALNAQNLPFWIASLAQKTHLTTRYKTNKSKQYAISYGFGQALQTAVDITVDELLEEDSPYVGLLAWEVNLLAYDALVSDEAGMIIGAVGPIALGEFSQTFAHKIMGATEPQGWDNQINNELVLRIQARRTWRVYESQFLNGEFDFLTGIDGGIGNLRSDLSTGVAIRFGQQLRKNFLSASVFPVQKFNGLNNSAYGWYLFANASATYVANDIFMNGNTFEDSHSVDLIHPQGAISLGFMANIYDFSILYTILYLSDEYQNQRKSSRFGSLVLTYHF